MTRPFPIPNLVGPEPAALPPCVCRSTQMPDSDRQWPPARPGAVFASAASATALAAVVGIAGSWPAPGRPRRPRAQEAAAGGLLCASGKRCLRRVQATSRSPGSPSGSLAGCQCANTSNIGMHGAPGPQIRNNLPPSPAGGRPQAGLGRATRGVRGTLVPRRGLRMGGAQCPLRLAGTVRALCAAPIPRRRRRGADAPAHGAHSWGGPAAAGLAGPAQ